MPYVYEHAIRENRRHTESRERYRGEYTPWEVHESGYAFEVTTRGDRKSDVIHSDHIHSTAYERSILSVGSDEPYSTRYESVDGNGVLTYVETNTRYISFDQPSFSAFLEAPPNDGSALTKARVNLNGNSAELGSNIGQAEQIFDQFANAAIRGAKVLLAAKRGDWATVASQLGLELKHDRGRTFANLWLEYSYGWKPLASDLYNLSRAVHDRMSTEVEVRGTGQSETGNSASWTSRVGLNSSQVKQSTRCVLVYTVDNSNLRFLSQIGLMNPLAIAWDLVPFSFVVDWFMPVGNTLESMTSTVGLRFKNGWVDQVTTGTFSVTKTKESVGDGVQLLNNGVYSEEMYSFKRTPYFDSPEQSSFYTNPSPYSTPRAANALALVRQLHR